jgi:hypothetical protein
VCLTRIKGGDVIRTQETSGYPRWTASANVACHTQRANLLLRKRYSTLTFVAKYQVRTEEIDIEMDAFSGPGRNEDM